MSNELFTVWHRPAPVAQSSGLDTIRAVLVAIENGRPLDSQSAAHLGTALRAFLSGQTDISRNLGLRPRRGRSSEAPLRRERLLQRDRLIREALAELGGNTPQNRLELQGFLDAYLLCGWGDLGFLRPIMELRKMHGGSLALSDKQIHRIATGQAAYAQGGT